MHSIGGMSVGDAGGVALGTVLVDVRLVFMMYRMGERA